MGVHREHTVQILASNDIDPTTMVGDQTAFQVLEAAILGGLESIESFDPEQFARDERTDLCKTCKPKEHDYCGDDINCPCCRQAREGES